MATKFLVKKFDEDLVSLVKSSTKNIFLISEKMGVEEKECRKRISQLIKKKLLVYDASLDQIGLSVDGYSFFEEKKKKHEKQARQQLVSAQQLIQPVETNFIQTQQIIDAEKQSTRPVDLHELMRIGAPNNEQRKKRTAKAVVPEKIIEEQPIVPAQSTPVSQEPSEDKCELCKSPFSLSVGKGSNPKFGHCFCGAAYHKDCFESIADNNSSCIRCGRKLELSVDKKTIEIVKGIKDAFED